MINISSIETNTENEFQFQNKLLFNSISDNNKYFNPKSNNFTSLEKNILYNSISDNNNKYSNSNYNIFTSLEKNLLYNSVSDNDILNYIFSSKQNNEEENSLKIIIDNNYNYNYINEKKILNENKSLQKKTRPGRKKESKNKNKTNRIHDRYSKDNITRKIQVHYLKFLRNFANFLIKEILFKNDNSKIIEFCPLKHKFMNNIQKNEVDSLKNKYIGEILRDNISPRYDSNNNINAYNEVTCKSNIIKKIFNKKYLDFFKDYYYNNKKINLSEFGLDKEFKLSNDIEFYEDLIKNNKTNSFYDDEKYRNKMEKIIKKIFLTTPNCLFD